MSPRMGADRTLAQWIRSWCLRRAMANSICSDHSLFMLFDQPGSGACNGRQAVYTAILNVRRASPFDSSATQPVVSRTIQHGCLLQHELGRGYLTLRLRSQDRPVRLKQLDTHRQVAVDTTAWRAASRFAGPRFKPDLLLSFGSFLPRQSFDSQLGGYQLYHHHAVCPCEGCLGHRTVVVCRDIAGTMCPSNWQNRLYESIFQRYKHLLPQTI